VRAVVQRVSEARVVVEGRVIGAVAQGLCVLLGIARGDSREDAERLAAKIARLRIFEGAGGTFERSVLDEHGEALVVSQFTLLAETARGNRPSFSNAAGSAEAKELYDAFCEALAEHGVPVATGSFGAQMRVELVNEGPVTIVLG